MHHLEIETMASKERQVELCSAYWTESGCDLKEECPKIHLCRYYLKTSCMKDVCMFSHSIHSDHNSGILKCAGLEDITLFGLRWAYKTSQAAQKRLPDACKFYNGMKSGCKHSNDQNSGCPCLHICYFFILDQCKFGYKCQRSHSLRAPQPAMILEKYSIDIFEVYEDAIIAELKNFYLDQQEQSLVIDFDHPALNEGGNGPFKSKMEVGEIMQENSGSYVTVQVVERSGSSRLRRDVTATFRLPFQSPPFMNPPPINSRQSPYNEPPDDYMHREHYYDDKYGYNTSKIRSPHYETRQTWHDGIYQELDHGDQRYHHYKDSQIPNERRDPTRRYHRSHSPNGRYDHRGYRGWSDQRGRPFERVRRDQRSMHRDVDWSRERPEEYHQQDWEEEVPSYHGRGHAYMGGRPFTRQRVTGQCTEAINPQQRYKQKGCLLETPPSEDKQEMIQGAMNLDDYISAAELEGLGLDTLKSELMSRGLKCGGTLQQRAERLWAAKGKSWEEIDPTFFAKPTKQKKK